jgi:hypothetical protein
MKGRLKVSDRVANFVGHLGAVMNMDACKGIFPAMVAVFAANAFGSAAVPVEAVGLVAGVDFLVDMFRPMTNVAGDLTTSVVVANYLTKLHLIPRT